MQNKYYYLSPKTTGSPSSPAELLLGEIGSSFESLNRQQTVKVCVSTKGGERDSYHEAVDWPCAISVNKYAFTSAENVTPAVGMAVTSGSSSFTAAYTSTCTLTADITNDDYVFVGWISASGDTLSTDLTYAYDIDGVNTIYAYFNQKPHVTLNIAGNGSTSFNPSSRITVSPMLTGIARGSTYSLCYEFVLVPVGAETSIIQKDNSTNDVIVTGNKIGTYVLQALLKDGETCASGEVVAFAQDTIEIEQYVTLTISGSHTKGGNVTLTANSSVTDGTYEFTVVDPDGGTPQSVSGSGNTRSFSLGKVGEYTFYVTLTKPAEHIEASDHNSWSASKSLKLRYPFITAENHREWTNVNMTYNEHSGNYFYYSETYPISSYESSEALEGKAGGNVYPADADCEDSQYYRIINTNGFSSSITPRIFMYDPVADELSLVGADTTKYRVKSICGKKTYYSNAVSSLNSDLSFFATFDGTLIWQTSTNNGITWIDGETIDATIPKDGVYTAKATATTSSGLTEIKEYNGDYRIYGAVTHNPDTTDVMSQFENISSSEFYNHYWVRWIDGDNEHQTNTYATVGNAINHCLAERKVDYPVYCANVRFAYNPSTNYFSRTFLAGSNNSDFLKIYGESVKDAKNIGSAIKFNDGSDWVYQVGIVVNEPPADVAIVANFDGKTTYLLSERGSEIDHLEILGPRTENLTNAPFEIVYDYKTNRVIAAWTPNLSTPISTQLRVDADLLLTRNATNSSNMPMLQFTNNGEATVLRRIIMAIEMNRNELFTDDAGHSVKGDSSRLFQITLPYEADLTSIFGLSDYGQKWVIQDYKGEVRSKIGWQGDNSDFWATLMWSKGTKLRKGRGYVLAIDLDYDHDFKTIGSIAKKTLYIPSPYNAEGYVIDGKAPAASMYSELKCTKPGRGPYDSDWRCIGAPSFYPVDIQAEGLEYYYKWKGTHNSYQPIEIADEPTLQPTRNYIIQYSGLANWSLPTDAGSSAPLRRILGSESPTNNYRIDLTYDSVEADRTYLKLSAAGTDTYVIGSDLLKMFAYDEPQIFTVTRQDELAANHVSDTTTRVLLGVSLPEAGEYGLRLREGGQRKAMMLFDAQEQVYADLAEGDYTFFGQAGKDTERFVLLFGQQPQAGTGLNQLSETRGRLRAAIAGGQLIVQSDEPLAGDVLLFDISGRLVAERRLSTTTYSTTLPLPSATGIYLIQAGEATTRIAIY